MDDQKTDNNNIQEQENQTIHGKNQGENPKNISNPIINNVIRLVLYLSCVGLLFFLANLFDSNKFIRGIIGLMFIFITLFFLSENIRAINYKTLVVGFLFQLVLAVLLLLTQDIVGIFKAANDVFLALMDYAKKGIEFLFASFVTSKLEPSLVNFTFIILPTIVFFGALIYLLYYIGIMELVIRAYAWVMMRVLGTSGAESVVASAKLFVGQTEAPLIIKPFLALLTRSEIFTVMSAGMATMAGGVMAAYVAMISPYIPTIAGHLLTAIILSVTASVYMSKTLIPETGEPVTRGDIKIKLEKQGTNIFEAITLGARDGMFLAFNVGAMLLAFISLITLLNDLVFNLTKWLFSNIGFLSSFKPFTFQDVLSLIAYPIAYLLGIPKQEAFLAASFISQKIVINEFVAYSNFAKAISENPEAMSMQTKIILSYALAGFANFSSIGIQIGGIGALEPKIRPTIAQLGLKALIIGNLANFSSAVIAGIIISHTTF
ncbi:MAG: nucleoside transporter C-terminal domain-containing protein [Candidatus Calescibacterium sp.]|nr:NupC/NupG family nucleoside CNT transporter [Candidatus Calescibacterium sp.]MDW8195429.1 nucleoside transporter C-terminal domain-containing protein [Candidatus Calescibacterium sp.]